MGVSATEFVISLQDRMSGPAGASTAALERLAGAQIRTATAAAKLQAVEVASSMRAQAAAENTAAAAASRDALAQEKLAAAQNAVAASAARAALASQRLRDADAASQMRASAAAAKQASQAAAGLAREQDRAAAAAKRAAIESANVAKAAAKKDPAAQAAAAKEAAITSELSQQLALEAKIATFDAGRAKQVAALEARYKAMKDAATGAGPKQEGGGELERLQDGLRSVGSAARFVDGPLGKVVRLLGKGGLAGAAAAAIAIVAVLVVKLVELGAALVSFAFEAANAARSLGILNAAAAGSAKESANLEHAIDHVASTTPLAKTKIAELGRELEEAGFKGKSLADALESVAIVSSAMGEKAGTALDSLEKKMAEAKKEGRNLALTQKELADTGLDLKDVAAQLATSMHMSVAAAEAALKSGKIKIADAVDAINKAAKAKFGDTIAAQMLDLGVQFAKFKENLSDLFSKIDLKPLLSAIKDLLSMFDKGTASGRAMRLVLTQVFTGIANTIAAALPYAKAFFIGMLILSLQVYVGFLKLKRAVSEMFGSDAASKARNLEISMTLGKVAALAILGALAALAVVISIVAAPFIFLYTQVKRVILIFMGLGAGIAVAKAAVSKFTLPNLAGAAGNMVQGLINGVMSKIGAVVAAMKSLGTAAMAGLNSVFHFGSPSKAMIQRGQWTGEGMAVGVDKSASNVKTSMTKLGDPKDASVSGGSGGGDRKVIHVEHLHIGSRENWEQLRAFLRGEFEIEAGSMEEAFP